MPCHYLYAPSKDRGSIQFYRKLNAVLLSENLDSEESIVAAGDFNCLLNPALHKRGCSIIPKRAVVGSIECLQSEIDLVQIWRSQPLKPKVTLGVKVHLLYYAG